MVFDDNVEVVVVDYLCEVLYVEVVLFGEFGVVGLKDWLVGVVEKIYV